MLKEHLSTSLRELIGRLAGWVDHLPRWLRPAFFGAGLVFAFMMWRGGLIVLPIAFVVLLFKNPSLLVHQVLPLFLLYAPGAGFLGGLVYGITEPVLGRLGKVGKVMQFVLGTWAYCVVLVFFIMPVIDPTEAARDSAAENWAISGGMGLVFGLALARGAMTDVAPNPDRDRRVVIGVVVVGAALALAMKIAGWW